MNDNQERINRIQTIMQTEAAVQLSDLPDFMLTHVPFTQIADKTTGKNITEAEVLQQLQQQGDATRLFVVYGIPGSGKSNLITWLFAKYRTWAEQNDPLEMIVWLPRGKNTLKEAIDQLLKQLKDVMPKELQDDLARSAKEIHGVTAQTIIGQFIEIIREDTDREASNHQAVTKRIKEEYGLSHGKLEALKDLLDESYFTKQYLQEQPEPLQAIRKIVDKLGNGKGHAVHEYDAEIFSEQNFAITKQDCLQELSEGKIKPGTADFALSLNRKEDLRQNVAAYMNSLVAKCMKKCILNASAQNLQAMFMDIRRSLKRNHRKLILFVEDVSIAQGISDELLESMIIDHRSKGMEDLCRVTSIVGTTPGYYQRFPDNVKGASGRIAHTLEIKPQDLLGERERMLNFAASYINAVELDEPVVKAWAKAGFPEAQRPLAKPEKAFATVHTAAGQAMSIFPFNAQALQNMFQSISDENARTPRVFIKKILEPVLTCYYENPKSFLTDESRFINDAVAQGNSLINPSAEPGFQSNCQRIAPSGADAQVVQQISLLLRIWGNATTTYSQGGPGGVVQEIFTIFGVPVREECFGTPAGELVQMPAAQPKQMKRPVPQPQPAADPAQAFMDKPRMSENEQQYQAFCERIRTWLGSQDKTKIFDDSDLRADLKTFILYNVDWQLYDIPYALLDETLLKKAMGDMHIGDPEQWSDSAMPNEDSERVSLILYAYAGWKYLGNQSWAYGGAVMRDYIVAMAWMEEIMPRVIARLRAKVDAEEIEFSHVAAVYLVQSLTGHVDLGDNPEQIVPQFFVESTQHFAKEKHTHQWNNLYDEMYKKISLTHKGETIAAGVLREAREVFSLYTGQTPLRLPYQAPNQHYILDAPRLLKQLIRLQKTHGDCAKWKLDSKPAYDGQKKGENAWKFLNDYTVGNQVNLTRTMKEFQGEYAAVQAVYQQFLPSQITRTTIEQFYQTAQAFLDTMQHNSYIIDNDLSEFFSMTSASDTYQQWHSLAMAAKWDKAPDILKAMGTVNFAFAHALQGVLQKLDQLAGTIEQGNNGNTVSDAAVSDDQQIQKALKQIKESSVELVEAVKNYV